MNVKKDIPSQSLPFEPESIESMRARVPAAIAEAVNPLTIAKGEKPVPGYDRKHIFDFECGIRMILSHDDIGEHTSLHASICDRMGRFTDEVTLKQMALGLLEEIGWPKKDKADIEMPSPFGFKVFHLHWITKK